MYLIFLISPIEAQRPELTRHARYLALGNSLVWLSTRGTYLFCSAASLNRDSTSHANPVISPFKREDLSPKEEGRKQKDMHVCNGDGKRSIGTKACME